MRAIALAGGALALILACAQASADWTLVSPDNGIHSAYADPQTIHRHGAIVSMQGMYNFAHGDFTPDGLPFHSTSVLREYDCEGRKVRLISYADHAGELASGRVVSTAYQPSPWQPVLEGSGDAAFLALACAPR